MKKILAVVFVAVFGLISGAHATSASSGPALEKIFYYNDADSGYASLLAHLNSIDILAPQTYGVDMNGMLYGSVPSRVTSAIATSSIKLMPLVVNQQFNEAVIEHILDTPSLYKSIGNELVKEAKAHHYIGWQFDMEHINVSYKDKYSAFVKTVGGILHKNDLEFSVAVVAKTSDEPSDIPKSSWDDWVGVFDYKALAPSVDFLSIMAYDDPNSIGPVAGMPFDEKAMKYALKYVSPDKISFGVPLYGYEWKLDNTGKRERGFAYVNQIFQDGRYFTYGFDENEQVPWVLYRTSLLETPAMPENRKLWYENAQSFEAKLALIKESNVRGFSAWVLGLEAPADWDILK